MSKRARRSKGGRPRKAGARFPGGKLVPEKVEPNARVLEERRRLLGSENNLERATHPLDLMLARGWITERDHRAGMAFGRIHAGIQLGAPGLAQGGPKEVTRSVAPAAARGIQDWTDKETAEIFDAVFSRQPSTPDERAERAAAQYRLLTSILFAQERMAVLDVCVYARTPQWVVERCAGRFDTSHEARRTDLVKGLGKLSAALFTKTEPARGRAEIRSFGEMNAAPPPGVKVEERVRYVTADGEEVGAVSERGVPFEVTVLRRRAVG